MSFHDLYYIINCPKTSCRQISFYLIWISSLDTECETKESNIIGRPNLKNSNLTKYLLIEVDLIYSILWVDLQNFKYFEMSFKLKKYNERKYPIRGRVKISRNGPVWKYARCGKLDLFENRCTEHRAGCKLHLSLTSEAR